MNVKRLIGAVVVAGALAVPAATVDTGIASATTSSVNTVQQVNWHGGYGYGHYGFHGGGYGHGYPGWHAPWFRPWWRW